jgi:biofilm PGA synthesis N-glycosyltransferase PgaC
MRRSLFRPLPADTILDDVLTPMRVVLAGFRVVFTDRARAYDRAAADADAEARRKIRTLAGNYQILALEPRLLLPIANPVWLQYVSHKVGRLLVPYAVLAIFVASIVLSGAHLFYGAALAAQVAFYLLAGIGAVLEFTARRREDRATAQAALPPVTHVAREIA